jgi:hypothetical protein
MEEIKFLLRLDSDLYDELIETAKKEKRSINQMICYILEKYLK